MPTPNQVPQLSQPTAKPFSPSPSPSDRNFTWSVFGALTSVRVLRIAISIASGALWARYVSKEDYGQFQLIMSFVAIASSLSFNGLDQSLTLSAAKKYDGNFIPILKTKAFATSVGSIALCIAAFYYQGTQPALFGSLFLAALFFPFYELQPIWTAWFSGRGWLKTLSGCKIGHAMLSLSTLSILILYESATITNLIIGLLGLTSIISVVLVVYIIFHRENNYTDKSVISFGYHATAASLLNVLVLTDKFIISEFLAIEDVAIYAIALVFPNQIKALFGIFSQMITPQISKVDKIADAWEYLKPKLPFITLLFFSIGIVGFFLIPVFIPIIFSDHYSQAAPYGKWLWLVLSFTAPASYLSSILRAQKKVKFVYIFELSHPVILIVLLLSFVHYGLWGIVYAKAIHYTLAAIFFPVAFYLYLQREKKRIQREG
jgi:O-antigen/teichoic acid export membrane protein